LLNSGRTSAARHRFAGRAPLQLVLGGLKSAAQVAGAMPRLDKNNLRRKIPRRACQSALSPQNGLDRRSTPIVVGSP
jgi:hypothetical protein